MVIPDGSVNGLAREILFFPGKSHAKGFAARLLSSELEERRRLGPRASISPKPEIRSANIEIRNKFPIAKIQSFETWALPKFEIVSDFEL